MELLTEKQQAVLDFIRAYIRENGLAPTIQEIATGMGWKSPNAAQSHVNALVRKGMLKIKRGANRGIVVPPTGADNDSLALEAATRIMQTMRTAALDAKSWPDVRLKAAIQVEVIRALSEKGMEKSCS